MKNTDDTFRSYDLGVMSPARCRCATSVCWFNIYRTK